MLGFIRSRGFSNEAHALYEAVVRQSRRPAFYRRWGVPDTPAGRFEMIALHAFLLLRRLKGDDPAGSALGQEVFDLMFADMDQSLREMGVGDIGVGKRVRRLAEGFYGRIAAYAGGLDSADPAVLAAALSRNLYAEAAAEDARPAAMANYTRGQAAALARQPLAKLRAGRVEFAPAPNEIL